MSSIQLPPADFVPIGTLPLQAIVRRKVAVVGTAAMIPMKPSQLSHIPISPTGPSWSTIESVRLWLSTGLVRPQPGALEERNG
jgi:hypothetical protein